MNNKEGTPKLESSLFVIHYNHRSSMPTLFLLARYFTFRLNDTLPSASALIVSRRRYFS